MFSFPKDKDGYLKTAMRDDSGKRKYLRVHRVVAMTFLENPNNYPVVNHKNGIKSDNRLNNLEWCSISENTKHGFRVLGREPVHSTSIKIKLINIETNEVKIFEEMSQASKELGVSLTAISSYFKRKERLGYKATILKKYRGEKL